MSCYAIGDLIPAGKYAYRIEKQLGEGGMATVFLARRMDLNSLVVLKVLDPRHDRGDKISAWVTRSFQAEARALSQMKSEFLPVVMDFGQTGDELQAHYYTMERIVGKPLKALLDVHEQKAGTRALSIERAVAVASQVAQGLAAVHRRGVVHCDIKPANLFVYRNEEGVSRVKIIDFGIALVLDDRRKRSYVGTPGYSSPEELLQQPISPASDIFALGIVLAELLTGTRPYAQYGSGYANAVGRVDIAAPSLSAFGHFPAKLVALADRMLSLEPERRPAALAAANELRTIARELAPADPSIKVTDPGHAAGTSVDEDRRALSIHDVSTTDVDVDLAELMKRVEAGAQRELVRADTQPAAAMAVPDALTPEVHIRTNEVAGLTLATAPIARPMIRDRRTVPLRNAPPRPADLMTAPPSRALPPPATDESGLYVPEKKVAVTTPMRPPIVRQPAREKADDGQRRRKPEAFLSRAVNGIAARRFGTLYLVAAASMVGTLIVLALYGSLQALIVKPRASSSAVDHSRSPSRSEAEPR